MDGNKQSWSSTNGGVSLTTHVRSSSGNIRPNGTAPIGSEVKRMGLEFGGVALLKDKTPMTKRSENRERIVSRCIPTPLSTSSNSASHHSRLSDQSVQQLWQSATSTGSQELTVASYLAKQSSLISNQADANTRRALQDQFGPMGETYQQLTEAYQELKGAYQELAEVSKKAERRHSQETAELQARIDFLTQKNKELQHIMKAEFGDLPSKGPKTGPAVNLQAEYNHRMRTVMNYRGEHRPALPESEGLYDGSHESPASDPQLHWSLVGSLAPNKARPFQPSHTDDVFQNTLNSSAPAVRLRQTVNFDKKPLQELLSSAFMKVENAIRRVRTVDITGGLQPPEARALLYKSQEHLGNKAEAYTIFQDVALRPWLLIGLVSHGVVQECFKDPILNSFQSPASEQFMKAWFSEDEALAIDADNFELRNQRAEERANCARAVVQTPGFWKWMNGIVSEVTDAVMSKVAVAIAEEHLPEVKAGLAKAVDEALRIGIRMRTEPLFNEFFFPRVGIAWESQKMVHRNPELQGLIVGDERAPYVVHCTVKPLVKQKSFVGGHRGEQEVVETVAHKAEVILCDRKYGMRPAGPYQRFRNY